MEQEKPAVAYTRPYNQEHARAGAQVRLQLDPRYKVEHLAWSDRKAVGIVRSPTEIFAGEWYANTGHAIDPMLRPGWDLVMAPLAIVQARPVFVGDELALPNGELFIVSPQLLAQYDPGWTWPKPKAKWPTTSLTPDELSKIDDVTAMKEMPVGGAYVYLANAIIAHECEAGNLVPKARFDEESRKLGAAERALEEAGFRCRDGKWAPEVVAGERPQWVSYSTVKRIAVDAAQVGQRNVRGDYMDSPDIQTIIDRNLGRA